MTLAIVGLGLVTPFGRTPAENVFFLRAAVPAPPPSPFVTKDGDRVDVAYCRWLGALEGVPERLRAMGERALASAHAHVAAIVPREQTQVYVCAPKARAGFGERDAEPLERAASKLGALARFVGDAGAFLALREARAALAGGARAVVVLAADTRVSVPAVEAWLRERPSRWELDPPPPSEGAAAMTLMDPHQARREGLPIVGTLEGAAVAAGASNDGNDDPVDGAAMVVALKQLPAERRARAAFGPWRVDLLRRDEWQLAAARVSERFSPQSAFVCVESKVGRLGAAAGLANAVYGAATMRHAACERADAHDAPFYAWAISPDGTRGAALLAAEAR